MDGPEPEQADTEQADRREPTLDGRPHTPQLSQRVVGQQASKGFLQLVASLGLADRKVELSRMAATMEGELADLQLDISQNPDLDTMAKAVCESSPFSSTCLAMTMGFAKACL